MSVNPKIVNLNKDKHVTLHMRIKNPTKLKIKGRINFTIVLPNKKRKELSKNVIVFPFSKKDNYIQYKINKKFKEGFYRVLAFFYCEGEKIFSLTKENDFFWALDMKKIEKRWDSLFSRKKHPLCENINPETDFIIRKAFKIKNPKILDLGCGSGFDLRLLSKKIKGKFEGVDFSDKAINHAKKINDKHINFISMDVKKINFKKNSYDIIYSFSLLHCLLPQDIEDMLEKIKKMLKKKGTFIVKTRSTKDSMYGKGKKIRERVFLHNGVLVNFFDKITFKKYLSTYFNKIMIKEKSYVDKSHGEEHKHSFLIAFCSN